MKLVRIEREDCITQGQTFNQKLSNVEEHTTVVRASVILLQKGLYKTAKINFKLIMCLV